MTRPAVLETDPAVWRAEALTYIEARVRAGHTVTADDLRRDLPEPPHPNAVGQVFRTLAGRQVIEKAAFGASTCRSRRGGPRYAWRLHESQRPRRFKAGENLAHLIRKVRSTR